MLVSPEDEIYHKVLTAIYKIEKNIKYIVTKFKRDLIQIIIGTSGIV